MREADRFSIRSVGRFMRLELRDDEGAMGIILTQERVEQIAAAFADHGKMLNAANARLKAALAPNRAARRREARNG